MKFPNDLLEQANHLATREARRPREASLRRATSASYYALFHLLSAETVLILSPNGSAATRAKLQRLMNHGEMKTACARFMQQPLRAHCRTDRAVRVE